MIKQIRSQYNLPRSEIAATFSTFVSPNNSIVNGGLEFKATLKSRANRQLLNLIRFIEKSTTLAAYRRRAKSSLERQLYGKIKTGQPARRLGKEHSLPQR